MLKRSCDQIEGKIMVKFTHGDFLPYHMTMFVTAIFIYFYDVNTQWDDQVWWLKR